MASRLTIMVTLPILLLITVYFYGSEGTSVVLLQESGIFVGDTYLVRTDVDLTKDLNDFTLCAWISLNFLRGESNYWISIGNEDNDKIISGVFENGNKGPKIIVRKFHPKINDEIAVNMKKFDFQTWHHFCFLFTSQAQFPYPGGYVNLTNKAYVDGELVSEDMKTIIKSNAYEVPRFVNVMLGQKINTKRQAVFSQEESFSGRLADVTMYKGELTESSIKSLANCETIVNRGVLLDWFVSAYEIHGDVLIEDVARASLCKPGLLANKALFNHGISHDYARFLCEKLGGELPTFGANVTERNSIYQELSESYSRSVSDVKCQVSENANTDSIEDRDVTISTILNVESKPEIFFWTGITEDTEDAREIFVNEYTNAPLQWSPDIWPGPVGNFSCTFVRGNYLVKKDCQDEEPCGICQIVDYQRRLRLKGLCVDDLSKDSDFDTEFYLSGLYNDRLYFRGIRASHIFVDPIDGRWTIQSLKSPGKISKLPAEFGNVKYPIGRLKWIVNNNETRYGICGLENGSQHILTFSDCHPDKFSCSTGQCIEIVQKCDGVIDCQDGSDELECEFLLLDKNYAKDKLPLIRKDEAVRVYFSIAITAYPKIDTANSKFTTDYDLNLKWYDPRLIFRNLKPDETFNGLNQDNKKIIWSPQVYVPNALGPEFSQLNDDKSSIMLLRENEEDLPEDFSLNNEARLYSGEKNAVLLRRKFSQEHACNFNLFYYPFDTQVCMMKFELRDKTEEFVQFEKEDPGITFKGDRNMADYEIVMEQLEIATSPDNHSVAVVKVVFRRQTGFHVITTFVQTMIIIIVAFVTFFFNIRNFSDRIMVNLVLLLILSTIASSAQAGVPKTSYFKMIDIWFLFLHILIVLTIICHTIITFILGSESAENKTFGNHRRLFSRRTNHSAATTNGSGNEDLEDYSDELANGKTANIAGIGGFLAFIVIFNIVFWLYALQEHGSPIENILLSVHDE